MYINVYCIASFTSNISDCNCETLNLREVYIKINISLKATPCMLKWWPSCIYSTSFTSWKRQTRYLPPINLGCFIKASLSLSNGFLKAASHHDVIQFICFKVQRIWLFNYASIPARPWRSSWIKAGLSLRDECTGVPTLVKLWTERSITHPFLSYRITVDRPCPATP